MPVVKIDGYIKGEVLKEARERYQESNPDMTVDAIARELQMTRGALYKMEADTYPIKVEKLRQMEKLYNVKLEYVIQDET